MELAAPEELFSKSGTADDAEEEAAIGQGATALMLDAILMDSSVGEGGSEPASRALPLLYSSAITLSCYAIAAGCWLLLINRCCVIHAAGKGRGYHYHLYRLGQRQEEAEKQGQGQGNGAKESIQRADRRTAQTALQEEGGAPPPARPPPCTPRAAMQTDKHTDTMDIDPLLPRGPELRRML